MVPMDAMADEHTGLLMDLKALSKGDTSFSSLFMEVLRIFRYHLDREEHTTIPLLRFLGQRNNGGGKPDTGDLRMKWRTFSMEYDIMISEHQQIISLLEKLDDFPDFSQDAMARDVAGELRHHVALEEQVLYPAAMAAGDLLP